MWFALIPLMMVVLLVIPTTRVGIAWVLMWIIAPPLIRKRHKFAPSARPVPVSPDAAADSGTVFIAHKAGELAALSFEPRGGWLFDKADGATRTHIEVLVHVESSTIATIVRTDYNGATLRTSTELMCRCQGGATYYSVIDYASSINRAAESLSRDGGGRVELPSLARAEWLWEAHRVFVASAGNPPADPLPASTDEWTARLAEDRDKTVERLRANGLLTPSDRRGASRFAIPACFSITQETLWPWKRRVHEAAITRERAFLHGLGLDHLLELAARSPQAEATAKLAAAPSALTTPDDRGTPRSTATTAALRSDERRLDPRFCAVIAQSQAARVGQYRRSSVWITVGMYLVVIVVAGIFRISIYLVIFGGLVLSILLSAFANAGRAHLGERAAADKLIRRGLCPSCLYGLADLVPESDGCLVCPECGAAWKANRVQEFTVFVAPSDDDPSLIVQMNRAKTAIGLRSVFFAQGTRAKDDRGERRTLISPTLRNEIAAAPTRAGSDVGERLRTARAKIRRSGRIARWSVGSIVLLLFVGIPVFIFVRFVVFSPSGIGPPGFVALGPALVGGLLALGVFRGNFGYGRGAMRRAMLESRFCPACAEDLTGRRPAQDGCVECICGAAWRVSPPVAPRVGTTPPTAPPLQSQGPSSSCTASSG